MTEEENIRKVGFTVDAGLIQRLGYELVGRAETAVSELIKNAYDADATVVDVNFIDSNVKGGTLIVSDNGVGMTEDEFLRRTKYIIQYRENLDVLKQVKRVLGALLLNDLGNN